MRDRAVEAPRRGLGLVADVLHASRESRDLSFEPPGIADKVLRRALADNGALIGTNAPQPEHAEQREGERDDRYAPAISAAVPAVEVRSATGEG